MKGETTFTVEVEGIGAFTFRRRTMGAYAKIQSEVSKFYAGVAQPTEELSRLSHTLATLKILTVRAPDGWDLDSMDADDIDDWAKLGKVYAALEERLKFFREGGKPAGQELGQAAS